MRGLLTCGAGARGLGCLVGKGLLGEELSSKRAREPSFLLSFNKECFQSCCNRVCRV